MPKKIRELIMELEMAGVVLTVSGQPGDDAKPYQFKLVREKIEETQK